MLLCDVDVIYKFKTLNTPHLMCYLLISYLMNEYYKGINVSTICRICGCVTRYNRSDVIVMTPSLQQDGYHGNKI